MSSRLALVALLAALVPAPQAHAALVELREQPGGGARLAVTALPGERNTVTVFATSIGGRLRAEVRDTTASPTAGPGCTAADAQTVHCEIDAIPDLTVDAGDGDDGVRDDGTFGRVELNGGPGDDTLMLFDGGAARGDAGDDVLRGSIGPDQLSGGAGRDELEGFENRDALSGGTGDDTLRGGDASDTLNGYGDRGPGAAGDDRLFGGRGNDHFEDGDAAAGRVGGDRIDGGPGRDTDFSYGVRGRPVHVDLERAGGDGERGENDSLENVEEVWGGRRADVLLGDSAGNRFRGGAGVDVMSGRGGDDYIQIEEHDRVSGGRGDDTFHGWFTPWNGTARCGPGRDVLTAYAWQYRPNPDPGAEPGPLVEDCEVIDTTRGLAIDPQPVVSDGGRVLTFRVLERSCCAPRLELTDPDRPHGALGSGPVGRRRVVVRVSRAVARRIVGGALVRAVIERPRRARVEWRFRAGG